MSTKTIKNWQEANQHYLMAAVRVVQEELTLYRVSLNNHSEKDQSKQLGSSTAKKELKQAAENLPAQATLDTLTTMFGLSSFERKVLLMCVGMELDSNFAALVASIQGDSTGFLPSFSLSLAAFPNAHWSALSPNEPLRYWRLIEVNTNQLLTKSPLRIDERVLHYLTGTHHLDERLIGVVEPFFDKSELAPSHKKLVTFIVQGLSSTSGNSIIPVIQLSGSEVTEKLTLAANICTQIELNLYSISAFAIPNSLKEITELQRLWNRESALGACALFLNCDEIDTTDLSRLQSITSFCEKIRGIIFISSRRWNPKLRRPRIIFEVHKPTTTEQLLLWNKSLNKHTVNLDGRLEKLVSQFNLSAHAIRIASAEALEQYSKNENKEEYPSEKLEDMLWSACCAHTRPRLDDLAQRIPSLATWDDLILPEMQRTTLREIAIHVRQQSKVFEEWGFAAKSSRGLGISALFTGESGTGKTMASEVIANELHLDLYRIDLSQVVNKYIGETEKNLKRIFDAAEEGGAILLFDEADALFGKRSEVRDSHDRYANIEVSYLLQRMEDYRGLAILTTNMKTALDKAFLRRIRFVVQFPFPDAVQRTEIWRRIFPDDTPTENLEVKKLARLNITGGNIRNIALNAAFIAADKGESVHMSHISHAARSEYAKLEKPMSTIETGAW